MTAYTTCLRLTVLLGICAVMTVPLSASMYPGFALQDDNSLVAVHFSNGVERWDVDGVSHLGVEDDEALQWFWYRTGPAGHEQRVDPVNLTFDAAASQATDGNGDGWSDSAYLLYHDALGRFDVEVTVTLDGGPDGSEQSDLAEQVTVTNTGSEALEFHFFQYADFNLDGTPDDDEVLYIGNAVDDVDEVMVAKQVDGDYALVAADVASVPLAHTEANTDGSLRLKLDNAAADDLDDSTTAVGDVEWAGQWDVTLAPGEAFQLSKDKMITPEPATLALLGGGAAMALLLRRRRR
ncbi:MAG: PEP-CTERM sorting domain-containing protein [Phycisphaerae bacterium]